MNLAELFGIILIAELFVPELFACQVENAVPHDVVAVIIAAVAENAIDPSAEDILCKKRRNRALTEGFVFPAPA